MGGVVVESSPLSVGPSCVSGNEVFCKMCNLMLPRLINPPDQMPPSLLMMDLGKVALVPLYCMQCTLQCGRATRRSTASLDVTSKLHSAILHPSIVVIKCGQSGGEPPPEGGGAASRTCLVGWSSWCGLLP